jgi:gluconokinase
MPDLANGASSSTPASMIQDKPTKPAHVQHIWVVTGPAGCGKSTVGNVLRTELGVPFLEGDDVSPHPIAPLRLPISQSPS